MLKLLHFVILEKNITNMLLTQNAYCYRYDMYNNYRLCNNILMQRVTQLIKEV